MLKILLIRQRTELEIVLQQNFGNRVFRNWFGVYLSDTHGKSSFLVFKLHKARNCDDFRPVYLLYLIFFKNLLQFMS